MRQLVDAFNDHMSDAYTPSWLRCLDEHMNTWLNKSVLPRLRGGPQETPHFGNGYHSIADDIKGYPIMWRMQLREGKDRPKLELANGPWALSSEFEMESKTAQLMLEMTEPIHGSGKIVSMDCGFCVTAGILALHDNGVYGQVLTKKR